MGTGVETGNAVDGDRAGSDGTRGVVDIRNELADALNERDHTGIGRQRGSSVIAGG